MTGSWTTSHDTCESSFRIQHRKPGRTAWDDSHLVPRAGVERAFLYGGLDPVQYEFRVQTTDEHGVIHNSNSATVMVLQDAAAGMAVGRPENVRAEIAPFERGLLVYWDNPLSIPDGKTGERVLRRVPAGVGQANVRMDQSIQTRDSGNCGKSTPLPCTT